MEKYRRIQPPKNFKKQDELSFTSEIEQPPEGYELISVYKNFGALFRNPKLINSKNFEYLTTEFHSQFPIQVKNEDDAFFKFVGCKKLYKIYHIGVIVGEDKKFYETISVVCVKKHSRNGVLEYSERVVVDHTFTCPWCKFENVVSKNLVELIENTKKQTTLQCRCCGNKTTLSVKRIAFNSCF